MRSESPQGRFADASLFDGRVITEAQAWGKHLFVRAAGIDRHVHVHLGLYGKFDIQAASDVLLVGQIRWRLRDESFVASLRGPTVCELLDPVQIDGLIGRLGPDPLRSDAEPEVFVDRVTRSRSAIATLLMDQRVIAGVGNVYRAEVLFRNRVDPMRPGCELRSRTVRTLWSDIVDLMRLGVQSGRIDTVRPEHEPDAMGRPKREDDHGGEVYVYRRNGQSCFVCRSRVKSVELGGRNLFWCSRCQRSG